MMIIKDKNTAGILGLANYEPGSVFEYKGERTTKFDGFWFVVGKGILNSVQLPEYFSKDLDNLKRNGRDFLADNIFAVNLETGKPCFFEEEDLDNMRKVKASVEID